MCGIAGIVDLQSDRAIDRSAVVRMTNALQHRGPDGEGFHFEAGLGFGHRRLAVIDRNGGKQPFHSQSGDGVLVFNGEIYNFTSLANESPINTIPLKTRSDTEVLTEGLATKGKSFIDDIRGMFAFAFWQRSTRTLTLARDRIGERPLYYTQTADGFLLFASELPALLASGLIAPTIDRRAVADYFLYGYIPDPKTIYENVQKVRPGELLEFRPNTTVGYERYWRPAFNDHTIDIYSEIDPLKEELLQRFDAAVHQQLVSDVPIGAFLSGGVDSSAVISSIAQSGLKPTACVIGFEASEYDERAYARIVAQRFDAHLVEQVVDIDAASLIDRIAGVYGEPFADSSALPTYAVCEAARQSVTVALSGDGGDEIFGGYRRYPMFAAEMKMRRALPAPLRHLLFGPAGKLYPKLDFAPRIFRLKTTLQAMAENDTEAYARATGVNLPERCDAMFTNDFQHSNNDYSPVSVLHDALSLYGHPPKDPLVFAQMIDFETWLPGRMLVKTDRAAMAHGLEVRPPLLDTDFIDWTASLPSGVKLDKSGGKAIFKNALRDRLPDEILFRRKQGFSVPLKAWLQDRKGPINRLNDSRAWLETGFFDETRVHQMMSRHQSGVSDFSQELWTLIMFDAFLRL
ncbi:MAG: asparagine synthase (glutamine-hydrolyzing) [Pseudomonadota bacterium]